MKKKRPSSALKRVKCLLEDEALDMVTELDHLNRQCICSLCTCGSHVCPGIKLVLYPKATFISKYKLDYIKHLNLSPPKRVMMTYKPSNQKMELKTSNEVDFRTPELSKTAKPVDRIDLSSSLKFIGKSQYKNDYPN